MGGEPMNPDERLDAPESDEVTVEFQGAHSPISIELVPNTDTAIGAPARSSDHERRQAKFRISNFRRGAARVLAFAFALRARVRAGSSASNDMNCPEYILKLAIKERETSENKHMGAIVRRVTRDRAVNNLARKLVQMVPAIDAPEYRPLIKNYARLAILSEKAWAHLKEAGLIDDKGELRNSINTYRQLAGALQSAARELGLTPTMAASLAKPVKFLDLDSMRDNDNEDEQ